jgi:magnesium chelatase subunit I
VHVPPFLEDLVVELTHQARRSPDVNQTSGVSVRLSLANYETLVANAVRRALRLGEPEAVPRVSDLPALEASTTGKLELEYAGSERSEREVGEELRKRALRAVFDGLAPAEGLASVVEAFEQGWQVEVSEHMPAREYLVGLDQIPGLREGAARLAGGDSPARLASAIEFILEGLHLQNRLNKTEREGKVRYAQG